MRGQILVILAIASGCQFAVPGTNVPPLDPAPGGSTGGGGTPPSSTPPPSGPSGSTTPPMPDLLSPPDMALAPVGAACSDNAQCATGFCGHSGLFVSVPGGYCTLDCGPGKGTCPAGSACGHLNGVGDYCLSSCPADPCRTGAGYQCCAPGGKGPKGCTPNQFCD